MASLRQSILRLLIPFITLTACATPPSIAAAPTPVSAATPTLTARQQIVAVAPGDRVELASGHYQLLMLYSPLWTSCRELAPVVNGLMNNYTNRVRFVRVNIHNPQSFDLQVQLGFSTTPEFYLIDPQGRVERKWDESVDLQELEQTIKALPPATGAP